MRHNDFGGCRTINSFVKAKLHRFENTEHSFRALFELMFAEKENILYERSEGYRILRTSYGEAEREILLRAATLKTLLPKLPQNAVVGIHMENSLSFIEMLWAVLLCGWCPLLMNLRLDDHMLSQALSDSNTQAVISDGTLFAVPTLLEKEIVPAAAPIALGQTGAEILLMSSGTSSSLKLCAYSAEEFYWQIHDSCDIIRRCRQMKKHYDGHLKQLTFLPFYHVFGLTAMYIWFAFFSRTFVQLNDLAPQTILNTVRRHRVTHIFAVPLFWQRVYDQAMKKINERGEETVKKFRKGMAIAQKIGDVPVLGKLFSRIAFREIREQMFGDSIRFLISGGSEISEEVLTFFNAIGYHIANGYGMSEVGITSVELSPKRRLRSAGFVGQPFSSVEYRLSDEGELLVRARTSAKYIIENGEKHFQTDWFSTRDLAACENGHYRILGRRDDLVVSSSGENLNPCLIEPRFEFPDAAGVCLIGVQEGGGTKPVLLVSVRQPITEKRLSALRQAVYQRASELRLEGQLGKIVLTADELMLPQEFKLNRRRLARAYAAGELTELSEESGAGASGRDGSALAAQLRALFAEAVNQPAEEIGDDADFFRDCGGTSLDYFAMISRMQEEYGISFPSAGGQSLGTVREFCQYIEAAQDHAL